MHRTPGTGRNEGQGRRRAMAAALAVLVALVFAATMLVVQPLLVPRPRSLTPDPEPLQSPAESTAPSGPRSPSATRSSSPGGQGVGDYRCLTVVEAKRRIEADGYAVGQVNANISGGPVDDTWLVERQVPVPGTPVDEGAQIDLVISSPFDVC
jgi:hypothetical protein